MEIQRKYEFTWPAHMFATCLITCDENGMFKNVTSLPACPPARLMKKNSFTPACVHRMPTRPEFTTRLGRVLHFKSNAINWISSCFLMLHICCVSRPVFEKLFLHVEEDSEDLKCKLALMNSYYLLIHWCKQFLVLTFNNPSNISAYTVVGLNASHD